LGNFALKKPPRYLLIFIKRFKKNRFFLDKLKTEVTWPTELNWNGNTWRWAGLIEHMGEALGGHYKSFIVHGDLTYEAADQTVSETLVASVASPYVLLYSPSFT
jgi:ubiquitin C-terminal hydrolase